MLDLEVKVMNKLFKMKEGVTEKFMDERGDTNVISVVIILVVVIGLAVTFKSTIEGISTNLWKNITTKANTFTS